MSSTSKNDNDDANKYLINIDFGVVPVGSIHKRTIVITNDLKASVQIFFKKRDFQNHDLGPYDL